VLGNFRLDFTDLTIPLAGISIQVHRTYDTLNADRSGDFGFGWQLSFAEARLRETVRVTEAERSGIASLFAANPFRQGTRVYLTNPAGRRVGFTFDPQPEAGLLGTIWHPRFTPDPGVYDTLAVEDAPLSQRPDGTYSHYLVNLPYNPSQYRLTTKDGLTYRYDQFAGLQDITDRNGNVLTYTPDGITSSSGVAIQFHRDALGRITQILDPAGHTLTYTYDEAGDLVAMTNQAGEVTTYSYRDDRPHYFDHYVCPSCVPVVRTEYDQAGRVVGTYDAQGNPVSQAYDVMNNTEVVADRLGNETVLVFDERGHVLSETNALGHTTSYQYDAHDNLIGVTNARGYQTNFTHDERGNATGTSDPLGNTYAATYNEFDQIATATDPLGHTATYRYDAQGNLVELINAAGNSSFLARDAQGRIAAITDNRGSTTTFVYGTSSLPELATNPDGSSRQFQYNTFGLVTRYVNETGDTTVFQYDATGKMLSAADAVGGVTEFEYEEARLLSVTDPLGRVQRFEHDAANRIIRQVDAAGSVTHFEYDANDRRTAVTDALGRTSRIEYDAAGRIVSQSDRAPQTPVMAAAFGGDAPALLGAAEAEQLARTTVYEYDAAGNLTAVTDPLGRITRYEYDPLDRLVRVADPAGNETAFTYDALGNLLTMVDALGRTTRYDYDALGQLVQITDPLGGAWTYGYDEEGNLVSRTDANGHTTAFAYDDRNRLVAWTDAEGGVTAYAYDEAGRVTALTDALGQTALYAYDEAGRLLSRTDALGGTASWTYDLAGNVLTETDEIGRTTSYSYDDLDQLRSVTDPLGGLIQFQYDPVGNLTQLVDPLGNAWTYAYDALDRLAAETDPLGHARTYQYDAADNLVSQTDRNGRQTVFAYDELDRLVSETWYDGTMVVNTLAFTYDEVGNLLTAADVYSRYAYTYDDLDRVLSSDNLGAPDAPLVVLSYAYDAVGNVVSVGDNLGVEEVSTYDGRGLLISRVWQGGGVDPIRAEFTYNALGQPTELRRFADAAGTQAIGRTAFTYDAKHRLTDLTHLNAVDAVLADYDYVRDSADQLIEETHHGQTSRYTYDLAGQLTAADHWLQPDETYTYDANGNRLQAIAGGSAATYQTGPANRVLSDGTYRYEYDREGNLTRKTEIASGNVTEYTYDHRHRLVQVQERSPGGIILHEVTYTYDVFDRRIAQTVDADGAGPQPAETTRFVYNGSHVWADFDAAGKVTARYLFGQSIDEILARWRPGEGTAWHLTDHLGTVRDIVNAAGAVINHLDYDSFGQLLAQTNPAFGDRYTFTGREYDATLGLYYLRARHYDPRLGRFTAEDPIRFLAGDTNLYRYVGNSPLIALDPWGTVAVIERAVKLAAGPAGVFIHNAVFRCFVWEIGGWAVSKTIFGDFTLDSSDVRSIVLGGISCAMFPGSAVAQAAFLAVAETLYLAATGASATEIGVTALMHTIGVAGGSGLSRYGSRVWGYLHLGETRIGRGARRLLADEAGGLEVPDLLDASQRARGGTYKLLDPDTGDVVRTGRTKDLVRREAEHARDPVLKDYDFQVDRYTDDYAQQRGREKIIHDLYGPPLNKIRPIRPNNPRLDEYVEAARRIE